MNIGAWLYRYLLGPLAALFGTRPRLVLVRLEDPPDEVEPNAVYLVGAPGNEWCAVLKCPCGCGADIRVSLIATDNPRWTFKATYLGSVTLSPSIWRNKGCRSHFFLRQGRIVWAHSAPLRGH